MATDAEAKKTVGRPQWPREEHTPQEMELQETLERTAKGEDAGDTSFPGTKAEVREAIAVSRAPPAPPVPQPDDGGGGISLATPEEAKVIVADLSDRLHVPPGFILVFKDRTGRMHPYATKEMHGFLLERKGYAHIRYRTGERHEPAKHQYHYWVDIIPSLSKRMIDALAILKDTVDRPDFLKEYQRLTEPISDDGFASPDTVRMRTMKTDYNLERLAKTRAYRHAASLYTGVGFGVDRGDELEDEATEREVAGADAESATQHG